MCGNIKKHYTFMIRETLETKVTVEGTDPEAALREVEARYGNGEYDLDRNCFGGVEFRSCCSRCRRENSGCDDDLREIDGGTSDGRLLCDACVADLEETGELTRCESCGALFSAIRLKLNPKTSLYEICPYCDEIWCE